MSYADRPRLCFSATDMMTNPSTANNENAVHLLDWDDVKLVNPPAFAGDTPGHTALPAMDDATYREWMTSLIVAASPSDQQADPTQPDWQPQMPGYWNYYGDHLTTFGSAKIGCVWVDEPQTTDDALLGAAVVFNAKLVDLDPADTFSSQLIAASFSVVTLDPEFEPVTIVSGVPTIGHSRWINFFRPGGAGIFQSVIPNDALEWGDASNLGQSPALKALYAAAVKGGGLSLRYCMYDLTANEDIMAMYNRFQNGEVAMNPKTGNLVGSIGAWNGSDMVSAPVGRLLHQPRRPFFEPTPAAAEAGEAVPRLGVKTHGDLERVAQPGTRAHADADETKWAARMGPAVAVVQPDRVVLDLLSAFPEDIPPTKPGTPPNHAFSAVPKHDFGVVNLALEYTDGSGKQQEAVVGAVPYDVKTYATLGGFVELPITPNSPVAENIASGTLLLRDAAGTELLRETEVPQVETDDRDVYLDLQETENGQLKASGTIELRAFSKGQPINQPLAVKLQLYADTIDLGTVNSLNPLVVTACELEDYPTGMETDVTIPAGGKLTVPIEADRAGCFKVRFVPDGMPVDADPSNVNWAVEFFGNFRALPWDDYSGLSDEEVTWPFVYREVFSYYAVLYPVMSLIIPWGPSALPNDPERVAQFASLMRQAVDESRVGTALAMPITRELSAGKRALVQRWCDLQLADD